MELELGDIIDLKPEAYSIISLIGDCNKISKSKKNQEVFKITNTTIQEMAELVKAVRSKEDFENLIDALFKIFYEGSGTLSRIPEPLKESNSIGFTIKHLRNEIRHDLEHGDQKEVLNKKTRFSKILEHYTGKIVYETLGLEDFSKLQIELFSDLQAFMEALKEYLIIEEQGEKEANSKTNGNLSLRTKLTDKTNQAATRMQSLLEASDNSAEEFCKGHLTETAEKVAATASNPNGKETVDQHIFPNHKNEHEGSFPQEKAELSQEQSLIVAEIQEFYRVKQRTPGFKEPGFQKLVCAAEKYFGSWNNALNASQVEPYIDWRKTRTLSSSIRQILNNNPLTLGNLAAEIRKIDKYSACTVQTMMSTIHQSEDILSVGAHGHKLYFLKGQEPSNTIYPILNRLDSTKIQEDLLRMLVKPMTKSEVLEQFVAEGSSDLDFGINRSLHKLWRTEKIWRIRFFASAGSGQKYSATDLFGNLAGKMVFCRTDCPEALAALVERGIRGGSNYKGFSSALSIRLKRILPKEVFELIQE